MDVYKLSPTNLQPVDVCTGLTSIHWVDKFSTAGSFTLETPFIKKYLDFIPPGTYLGISDDSESMMIVDKHEIRTDDEGVAKLTISGRTAETFLENRYPIEDTRDGIDEDPLVIDRGSVEETMKSIVEASSYKMSTYGLLGVDNPPGPTLTFPVVYDLSNIGQSIDEYTVPRESTYSSVLKIAEAYGISFRLLRPAQEGQPPILRFKAGNLRNNNHMFVYERGDILDEQLIWDITNVADGVMAFTPLNSAFYGEQEVSPYEYRMKLVDLSDQELRGSIRAAEEETADASSEAARATQIAAFNASNYSNSARDAARNIQYASYPTTSISFYTTNDDSGHIDIVDPAVIGNNLGRLARATVDHTDATSELTNSAQELVSALENLGNALSRLAERYAQLGYAQHKSKLYYKASQRCKQYTFQINPNAPSKYGKDYFLGDVIKVRSSWGDDFDMRVDGYVRSLDESGYREYPELVWFNDMNM